MALTDEQKAARYLKIMASAVAAYAGMNPYATPYKQWAQDMGLDVFEGNLATRVGEAVEEGLVKLAAELLEMEVQEYPVPTLFHPDYQWGGATPDAILSSGEPLQIKAHGLHAARHFAGMPGDDGEWDNNLIPEWHLCQVTWEMWVYSAHRAKNIKSCWLGCQINTTDFRLYHIRFDRDLADLLRDRSYAFWQRHLDPKGPQDAPEIDGSDFAGEYLRKMFPRNDGTILPLDPDMIPWAERYAEAHNRLKELETAKKDAQHHLIQAVGEADGMEGVCTFKAPKPKAKTDWEALAKRLFANGSFSSTEWEGELEAHTTIAAPSRRFNLTFKPE